MENESQGTDDLFSAAIAEWGSDQRVNWSPSWKGRPKGAYFAELLAARPEAETKLAELLNHENKTGSRL